MLLTTTSLHHQSVFCHHCLTANTPHPPPTPRSVHAGSTGIRPTHTIHHPPRGSPSSIHVLHCGLWRTFEVVMFVANLHPSEVTSSCLWGNKCVFRVILEAGNRKQTEDLGLTVTGAYWLRRLHKKVKGVKVWMCSLLLIRVLVASVQSDYTPHLCISFLIDTKFENPSFSVGV